MAFDVVSVRAAYPALADGFAYLDGAAGTQVPASVIDAIGAAYRAGLGNAGGEFPASLRSTALTAECRQAVADLVGGTADGVILGPNMTTLTYRLAYTLASQLGRGRRSDRLPARPRRERAALDPRRPAGRRHRPLGRSRHIDRRAARGPVRGPAVRANPAGRGHRGQQRPRHPAGRGRDHRPGPRGRSAQLRGRGACHPARPGGRDGARRGFLRDQRVQVVRAARGGGDRRPGPAGDAAPGQADAGARLGARAVRAGHPAVRRPGRGHRGRRAPGPAGRRRGGPPPPAAARLDGRSRGTRAGRCSR